MIAADRNELEAHLRQVALQIREKELTQFTENFAVLSTQSVFLAGLGVGGLTMTPVWKHDQMIPLQIVFYMCISTSLAFNILTMCITSWSMIFGPGLGIRGPAGSMSRAVRGMYAERRWALRFYVSGILSMVCAGIALGWLKFSCFNEDMQDWTAKCYLIPSLMTTVFLAMVSGCCYYMVTVTGPRFSISGSSSRPNEALKISGLDPESGRYESTGDTKSASVTSRAALDRGFSEIETLVKDGMLSAEQGKKQKDDLVAKFLHHVTTDKISGVSKQRTMSEDGIDEFDSHVMDDSQHQPNVRHGGSFFVGLNAVRNRWGGSS